MAQPQRASIEQIVTAYRETGSIWKAGKRLGIVGQSVWERLKAVDYQLGNRIWDAEELAELAELAQHCTISDIARRLGRPYYAVAIKISRMGLGNRAGNRKARKIPRGSGLTKPVVHQLTKELDVYEGTLRQFSRQHGLDLETMVHAIQSYELEFWKKYSEKHTDIPVATCSYCGIEYHPMTAKQKTCTRKCSATAKRDEQYFGGNRRNTVGLSEGVCQLCLQPKDKGLSSHHVLGKENDPKNECLVALCAGCHQLVTQLSSRRFVDLEEGWENLITLVMGRRMADKKRGYAGAYACVDLEYLSEEEVFQMTEQEEASLKARSVKKKSPVDELQSLFEM